MADPKKAMTKIQERPPFSTKNVNGGPQAPLGGLVSIRDLKGVL
jgi:hypothetical protein